MVVDDRNPYAGYGVPVRGPAFIGRGSEIRELRNRALDLEQPASTAIIGPPRIGKSSLAAHVCSQIVTAENAARFVYVWITVSGLDSEQSLFRELASEVYGQIVDRGADTPQLADAYRSLTLAESWDAMRRELKRLFRRIAALDLNVVAVLDEFDAARGIFGRAAPFELLRALAYEPDLRVVLVTTSRRHLEEIVVKSTAEVSNFPQIFGDPISLGCFTDAELAALVRRSPCQDPWFQTRCTEFARRETGGHPFLASAILSALHSQPLPGPDDLDAVCLGVLESVGPQFVRYYDQLLELFRDNSRLNVLLEIVFGPQLTARPIDATLLSREGIIKNVDGGWRAFSENFQEYLSILERKADDWSLWHKTETVLRSRLHTLLEEGYGETWLAHLTTANPRVVQDCSRRREHARRGFGDIAPDDSILEYAYPHELLAIIMVHWDTIGKSLGHEKDDWRIRLELLARLRTPMAHNRKSRESLTTMELFRQYCRELLEWLNSAARPA